MERNSVGWLLRLKSGTRNVGAVLERDYGGYETKEKNERKKRTPWIERLKKKKSVLVTKVGCRRAGCRLRSLCLRERESFV